jgi:hypothetical protein
MDPYDPLTALPNFDAYGDTRDPPSIDPLDDIFSGDFNFSGLFNVDLDQLPWTQDGDPERCDTGFEASPPATLVPRIPNQDNGTRIEANTQPLSSVSHHQRLTTGAGEVSPCKAKSNSLTDAEWEEIFKEVLPLYMDQGLKCILKTLPEKTNLKPRYT